MSDAGIGAFDSGQGTFGFKATSDGKVILGNTSDDVIQVTGSLEVDGDMQVAQYIKHKGDGNTWINFSDNRIRLNAGGNNFVDCQDNPSAPHKVRINNGGNNIDFVIKDNSGDVYFTADASTSRVGIGITTPSVELEVDGTTKSTQHVTAVGTQDLGNGQSSNLSISAGVMILDADSIQGVPDAGSGMTVHTLSLPSGTTNGQRLTLIVNTTFGPGDNVIIMPNPTNIGGAFGALVANSKTSVEFIWYGTHWFPVQ